ncbi:ATP-dependent DNA helicase RecG [Blattabacterium cuenoti]|uniref:ATP-dependent DNA helicase RecG n=1 Tax=Blattabacterium cuenoti TaxID=1653831 RepID=UPI00163D2131|nr:ATP-dependent DNA helicase RecG [Blattabacterium cuenoti]
MSFHVLDKSIINLGISLNQYQLFNIELNIRTYEDLILFYPKKYIYSPLLENISKLKSYININSLQIQIIGKITKFEEINYKNNQCKKKILIANFEDNTGFIELVWFKHINFLKKKIKKYTLILVSGKINVFRGKIQIFHPELQYINDNNYIYNSIYPIYYIPNKLIKYGINNFFIRKMLKKLIIELNNDLNIIDKILIHQNHHFMTRKNALIQIHFPQSLKILSQARYRMKFEELFFLKLSLLSKTERTTNISDSYSFSKLGNHFEKFYNYFLPFSLTQEQKRVFKEIRNDLKQPQQMNRLLQGDVGCGKTIIAILSMLLALDNGFQSCLMVPTEVLAIQHYLSIKKMFFGIGINIALLTSSIPKSTKDNIYNDILKGKISILIGTHSLIQESIKFKNLGLAIIDEQQRFGVEQRSKIWSKNIKPPHILIMTATPIPRTLAMTIYNDLKISIIKDIPLNRKPIITIHVLNKNRKTVINIIKQQLVIGRQVYIVYPMIKQTSSHNQYKSLMLGYQLLKNKIFSNIKHQIGILYGEMSYQEKNLQINRFLRGETKIMVSTTVIEVGVDVPNASVMLIENANSFGLSQLHQLRGRVGRGPHQSYCIMMTDNKINVESSYRIKIMCQTNDGLEIAKKDLNLRGSGDLTGTKQSGKISLRIANLIKDHELMKKVIPLVKYYIKQNPNCFLTHSKMIKNYFYKYYQSFWKDIG